MALKIARLVLVILVFSRLLVMSPGIALRLFEIPHTCTVRVVGACIHSRASLYCFKVAGFRALGMLFFSKGLWCPGNLWIFAEP